VAPGNWCPYRDLRTGRRRYPPALEALAMAFIFSPFLDASQMMTRIRLQERRPSAAQPRAVCVMYCPLCHSNNRAKFTTELMIHFSGFKQIDNPGVLTFPMVSICFDCGFSGFATSETQLQVLRNGIVAVAD
jgi:hypothetical protein